MRDDKSSSKSPFYGISYDIIVTFSRIQDVNMLHTLFVRQEDGGVMISTTPLETSGWEPLPLNSLLVYDNGTLVYQGENHRNEYIDVMGRITLEYNL